ncbi:DUF393 domain-containing protein [Priestia filamentosa]|jgi:predicted DCC family thiol-disulfide oxidoreductase YuxK|uniref:thiol-disulfide oxidoreductase DCC family protein n=1 Tax=Priestia filamentosa TaxID=1402861 RepID=UPI001FB3D948|nr:DUF393 domain-containing protein [Priestia filamentosa]MED3726239.1 DUF393 domain-containing protein [Priestia filamentosa]UOE59313.1 DUF393 domain-containing protein [Priestia filamentosa]
MKHLVFYDADCPLCSNVKKVVQALDWGKRLDWMPVQSIQSEQKFRFLAKRNIYDEIHMISRDNELFSGFYTVRKILKSLPLTWPIGMLLSLPLMEKLGVPLYTWVSENRYEWFGRYSEKGQHAY